MSLLCRECSATLVGQYQVLCLLGHTKTGLVNPGESLVRLIVCSNHDVHLFDIINQSRLHESDADALIFALVPGITSMGKNFNGAYSIDEDEVLKKNCNFEQPIYLTSIGAQTTFPISFMSLLAQTGWPDELSTYKIAVERYVANISQAKQRQQQTEVDRLNSITQANPAEQLRKQYSDLIQSATEMALANKAIPLEVVNQLDTAGLLKPSTTFRSSSLFPGEYVLLHYEFDSNEKFCGNLGFDRNLNLISIDEAYPVERQLHRKKTNEDFEWVEISV